MSTVHQRHSSWARSPNHLIKSQEGPQILLQGRTVVCSTLQRPVTFFAPQNPPPSGPERMRGCEHPFSIGTESVSVRLCNLLNNSKVMGSENCSLPAQFTAKRDYETQSYLHSCSLLISLPLSLYNYPSSSQNTPCWDSPRKHHVLPGVAARCLSSIYLSSLLSCLGLGLGLGIFLGSHST